MSYQVLARKYRSQSFDQLIGQTHITQTLMNALRNNRLPHALLFTGLRGTGKTSSARILAKSIRCTQAKDFVPCNVCQDCLSIAAGNSVDVIEIDGASNNGVDAIRDLRDNVMFMPATGKHKIFIIDEVHMLSTSAFNALLKTLEEPPDHVIFIMATTEVHKIPQTILSRCQRYDFRRISLKQLTEHLKYICKEENISADEKALWLIARQGDGSARDSITLLDQVINFSSGKLTAETVTDVLGLTDRSLVMAVFEQLLHRDGQSLISSLEKLSLAATNPSLFLEDITRLLRHSLLLKANSQHAQAPEHSQTIDLPIEEVETLTKLTSAVADSDLHMLFDMCIKSLADISRSFDPLLILEVSLLRMVQAPQILSLQELFSTPVTGASEALVEKKKPSVQTTLAQNKPSAPAPASSSAQPAARTQPVAPTQSATFVQPSAKPTTTAMQSQKKSVTAASLIDFISSIKQTDPVLGAKCENLMLSTVSGKNIEFQVQPTFGFLADQLMQADAHKKLQGFIDSFYGVGYDFTVVKTKSASGDSAQSLMAKKEAEAESSLQAQWAQDPRVQKAQQVFNAKIKVIGVKS